MFLSGGFPVLQAKSFLITKIASLCMKKNILLRELRNNARHPISVISRKEGIPVTTLYAVLNGIEEGIIKKYVSILGDGLSLKKEILLVEASDNAFHIRNFLCLSPAVNNLYRTNTGFIAHLFLDDRKEAGRVKRFLKTNNVKFSSHDFKESLAMEKFIPE